jgi:hypothetical protein
VLTTKIMLSTTSTPMTVKSTTFCQVLLTQGPRSGFYVRALTGGWPHSVTAGALSPGSRKVSYLRLRMPAEL